MIYETLEDWKELAQHLRRELDTSQADVTRLTAELAESVRALAVSQGEVKRSRGNMEEMLEAYRRDSALDDRIIALSKDIEVSSLRGDLERARGLLADVDWARGSGESFEEIVSGACLWCGEESTCPARVAIVTADTLRPHAEDCAYAAWYRDTFLAEATPPAPTASPEPEATTERVATCAKHGANRWTDAGGIWRCAECERPAPYRASPEVTVKENDHEL